MKRLVDEAVKTFSRIDVIIDNAGLMPHSPLERLKIDDWDRTIDVKQQKSGHFINVSSVAGHKVRSGSAVYAATNTAVLHPPVLHVACAEALKHGGKSPGQEQDCIEIDYWYSW